MKQEVKHVEGIIFSDAVYKIKCVTDEMNRKGYKLTFATCQCYDNNPSYETEFLLVFTKEE